MATLRLSELTHDWSQDEPDKCQLCGQSTTKPSKKHNVPKTKQSKPEAPSTAIVNVNKSTQQGPEDEKLIDILGSIGDFVDEVDKEILYNKQAKLPSNVKDFMIKWRDEFKKTLP